MAKSLEELKSLFEKRLTESKILLSSLQAVTESLKIQYGEIPEIRVLQNLYDCIQEQTMTYCVDEFEQVKNDHPEMQNNPEVIAAFGSLQAIIEERKKNS